MLIPNKHALHYLRIDPEGYRPRFFAVFDPTFKDWGPLMRALGSDHVELESTEHVHPHGAPRVFYRARQRVLGQDAVIRVSQVIARTSPKPVKQDAVFWEIVQGSGLLIPAHRLFVCEDLQIGRAHYAAHGGPGGPFG